MSALEAFRKQEENIGHLLRAADVYTQHVIAAMRQKPVDLALISKIVENDGLSSLNYSWRFYLTKDEYNQLRENGKTKKICEEIVLAVYTAIEHYLINKFMEYLHHSLSAQPPRILEAVKKRISFRDLEQIKKNYLDYFAIHLPSFKPDEGGFEESWFKPNSAWEGITVLSKARNEIAHEGTSKTYEIFYLIDAYAPLHFVSRWVALFDYNFDPMLYEDNPKSS